MSEEIVVVQSRHPVRGWKAVKEVHKNGFPSEVSEKETLFEGTGFSIEEIKEKVQFEYGFDEEKITVGM